jgi:hypothetical protein
MASGIPISTLGKLETDVLSMQLDRLFQLCDALGVPVTEFFDALSEKRHGQAMGRRSVQHRNSGLKTIGPNYDCTWLFAELSQKALIPAFEHLKARSLAEFGPLLRHPGEEFALVLQGRMLVLTEVYEPELLGPMEGIYIDSQMGHAYLNANDAETVILNVSTDPSARHLPAIVGAVKQRRKRTLKR